MKSGKFNNFLEIILPEISSDEHSFLREKLIFKLHESPQHFAKLQWYPSNI